MKVNELIEKLTNLANLYKLQDTVVLISEPQDEEPAMNFELLRASVECIPQPRIVLTITQE